MPPTLTLSNFQISDGAPFMFWTTATPGDRGPWSLAYQSNPLGSGVHADIVGNTFAGHQYTPSALGWWSAAIPGTSVGNPGDFYIFARIGLCTFVVDILLHDTGSGHWQVSSNIWNQRFPSTTCTPFLYSAGTGTSGPGNSSATITGTHGGGDLTPDASGNIGSVTIV